MNKPSDRSFFIFVLMLLLFTACSSSNQNTSDLFVMTRSGVGPLHKDTMLTAENLQKLLPGYLIKEGNYGVEDEVRPLFEVFYGEEHILKIYPDVQNTTHLNSIGVVSPRILSPLKLKIGDPYSDFDKVVQNKSCVPGAEQLSGQVICTTRDAPDFKYLFSGTWNGPDYEIPPPEVLSSFKIIEIVWINTQFFEGQIVEVFETGLGPLLGINMTNAEGREFSIHVYPEDLSGFQNTTRLIGQSAAVTYTVAKNPLVVGIRLSSTDSPIYFSPDTPKRFLEQQQLKVSGKFMQSVQGDLRLYITLQDEEGIQREYLGVFELLLDNEDTYIGKNVELIYIEQEEKTVIDIQIQKIP
ncbi:MAG: DUF1131 family protein [Candidatus Aminicenantes bacterium]|nr:DUF1131 family protein [Candidatus Aminicenantes bacterium]